MKCKTKVLSTTIGLLLACLIAVASLTVSAQTGTWMTRSSMPTPRSHLAVGEANGILNAIGGFRDRTNPSIDPFIATLEAYDPSTDTWTTKTSMPTPRWIN